MSKQDGKPKNSDTQVLSYEDMHDILSMYAGQPQASSDRILVPPQPLPSLTVGLGSHSTHVFVFFHESEYDRDILKDSVHGLLEQVAATYSDQPRRWDWTPEKYTFIARFRLCQHATERDPFSTIFMGESNAFDLHLARWDAAAAAFHRCCEQADHIEVCVDPVTDLVAIVARRFPLGSGLEEDAAIDENFLIEEIPIDYLRFDGVMHLRSGHRLTSLAQEALRIKVLCVRDGVGLGGFRLPSRYRLDGLILQGRPGHQVYLSQLFSNLTELPSDDKVGRRIDYVHIGTDVDLGEGRFPIPPMHLKVLSVQFPQDLDKLAELLEGWEGTIEKLVLWGYRDIEGGFQLHEAYPLFMALITHQSLPIQRVSWIESRVGSHTFEWMRYSDVDCQIFGDHFQHLSVDTVSPGQLMMVLRGLGQSLSPPQIEQYFQAFHHQLDEVPVMVKRLFFGTQNFSLQELQQEVDRIQSEQRALWSRLEQNPARHREHSASSWESAQKTDTHRAWNQDTAWGHDTDSEEN